MKKFKKRPVVIEAVQWFKNGDHPEDQVKVSETAGHKLATEGKLVRYFRHPDVPGHALCDECGHIFHVHGWIDTKEDGHRVCPGDWIITGIKGEKYPCKPDIFAGSYDPVPEVLTRGGSHECYCPIATFVNGVCKKCGGSE